MANILHVNKNKCTIILDVSPSVIITTIKFVPLTYLDVKWLFNIYSQC